MLTVAFENLTDQKIDDALLTTIVSTAQSAATSSFLQGATVIRVRAPEAAKKWPPMLAIKPMWESAAEFLVFCADFEASWPIVAYSMKKPFAGDFTEHFIIATVDVALMAQNMVIAAEAAG